MAGGLGSGARPALPGRAHTPGVTSTAVPTTRSRELIGSGLYDVAEVSRLVGVTVETILRWTSASGKRPPIIEPQLDPFFSFHDLLTLQLVRELSRRNVRLDAVARGIEYLQQVTGVDRPFAHQRMGTSGRSWLSEIDGLSVDIGHGGQLAWNGAVESTLVTLSYGDDGMASVWRPATRVWLNPHVQAGASCIDESRTTTHFVSDLIAAGTDVHDIVWQFELELDDVLAAQDFEDKLDRRQPLELVGG